MASSFKQVANFNAFLNDKAGNDKRPDYSNSRCKILTPIPAGEFSLGIWKTDRGLSISLSERPEDGVSTTTQTEKGGDNDLDDFSNI